MSNKEIKEIKANQKIMVSEWKIKKCNVKQRWRIGFSDRIKKKFSS